MRAQQRRRNLDKDLSTLPMDRFVPSCLSCLNQSGGNWKIKARSVIQAVDVIAHSKQLPAELVKFYEVCDGFESIYGDFSACIYPIRELQIGANHSPTPSSLLASYWNEHGNDSDKPGLLSILPPNNLAALATNAFDSYIDLSSLDLAILLCPPINHNFIVLLIADSGKNLPRGTVLRVEFGIATRYPCFKSWLATEASIFGSLSKR